MEDFKLELKSDTGSSCLELYNNLTTPCLSILDIIELGYNTSGSNTTFGLDNLIILVQYKLKEQK